jgi:hypothetical protein
VIDPDAATAEIYEGSDGTGILHATAGLDRSLPWYLRFVATSGTSAGYPPKDVRIDLFGFRAEDLSSKIMVEEVSGSTCGEIPVRVLVDTRKPLSGFSWGIRHDPAVLEVVDVTWSGILSALRGGNGPGFWAGSTSAYGCPGGGTGATAGMVVHALDPLGNAIPPSSGPVEVATITYRPVGGVTVGAESALELVDCLQPGPSTEQTACVLSVDGNSVTPIKIPGKVRIASSCFRRGDCNDDGKFDISDPIGLLDYLFSGGSKHVPCREACNAADDGTLDISDPIRMLARLFTGGDPLPPPYKACGDDPTPETLGCEEYTNC